VGPLYGGMIIEYGSYHSLFWSVTAIMLLALGAVMLANHRHQTKLSE